METEEITLDNSPLTFIRKVGTDERVLLFDSSESECPVPFISAQAALKELGKSVDRVVMINHTEPMRLLNTLDESIGFTVTALEDGRFEIIFFRNLAKK
jgi:hypothetical protein